MTTQEIQESHGAYKYLVIDIEHNMLLCDSSLVGLGEIVEISAPDDDTPRQACGKILRKLKDPNVYVLNTGGGLEPAIYMIGSRCVLRILARNRSGALRRKSSPEEKLIVNLEKNGTERAEKQVVRAKTGSVRKRKKK